MLRKLMKHEFRATGRIMWVIYAAMALLSVFANVAMRLIDTQNAVMSALSVLVLVLWTLALVFGVVMTFVLMIRQFHKNLLTDEGYLMFTLPGTVHHLVLSKLIVATVWFMVSILVVLLCVLIAVVDNVLLREALNMFREMFRWMTVRNALNGTTVIIEVLVLLFVSIALSCLQFYSAMAVGYGFTGHKGLWSVVNYFGMQIVLQVLGTLLMVAFGDSLISVTEAGVMASLSPMQSWHLSMLGSTALSLALSAVFYIITVVNLQKRLNLS